MLHTAHSDCLAALDYQCILLPKKAATWGQRALDGNAPSESMTEELRAQSNGHIRVSSWMQASRGLATESGAYSKRGHSRAAVQDNTLRLFRPDVGCVRYCTTDTIASLQSLRRQPSQSVGSSVHPRTGYCVDTRRDSSWVDLELGGYA